MHRHTPGVFGLAIAFFLATEAPAAQRAFVASYGNDVNAGTGCLLANPCRTFATAMTQVDSGGEVVALDAAGYGAVTIDRSVTLTTNSGYHAGIAASTGSAITIAAAGLKVVLRGLALNGIGASTGITVPHAGTVTVENCIVGGFVGDGISVTAPARIRIVDTIVRRNGTNGVGDGVFIGGGASATLNNVTMTGNARAGLAVRDLADATTTASVANSDASFNSYGYLATQADAGTARLAIRRSSASLNVLAGVAVSGANALAAVSGSQVTSNEVGLRNDPSPGILESYGTNVIEDNNFATVGPITGAAGE